MERTEQEHWKAREVARLLALVETERRYYQEIVASVPVGLLVLAPDLSIVSSNREVRKIFGLRGGDAVRGKSDILLPESVLDRVREVLNTGNPVNNFLVHIEGEPGQHLRLSVQSIRNWDNETEQEALVTIEDVSGISVTPQAHAADIPPQAAQPEETQPQNAGLPASELLANLDAIVWAVELPSMQFLYVNDKAQELLGHPAEEWLNSPAFWKERIHPDDREWVLKSYERATENWSRHSCEYRSQTPSGKVVWLRETARLAVDEQGLNKHLIGIAVDVTQRKLLEQQVIRSERVDALGKLGNRVSREIQNLLMVVSGYGEELTNALPVSHPLYSDLQEILSATDRLRGLANQISVFGRRRSVPAAPVDLGAFMHGIEPGLKTALGEKIQLDIKMFPASIGVQADAAQLEQLIVALAERAHRGMSDGGILGIECSPIEITEDLGRGERGIQPGVYAVIAVEDNGPTPDAEALAALFESIPASHDPKAGEGMLLPRIYKLVRQWGGDISVSPQSPRGTLVQVFLPRMGELVEAAPEATPAPAEAIAEEASPESVPEAIVPEAVPEPPPVLETILIVEEDAGIRGLVKKILRRQNYVVLEASSAEEALRAAEEHSGKIELLIADITAEHFDGSRLAHSISTQYPETQVLYLSGYTDDPSAHSANVPSGSAFLQKPFTLGSLLHKVREVLEPKPVAA